MKWKLKTENMNWYIGMEIVCVKTHPLRKVIGGNEYVIKGLRGSFCNCGNVIIDVGIRVPSNSGNLTKCNVCKNELFNKDGIWWFHENRFAPKQYLIESESAVKQLMKEIEITETK